MRSAGNCRTAGRKLREYSPLLLSRPGALAQGSGRTWLGGEAQGGLMNSNRPMRLACSEEFAELCALSTTGALTTDEQLRLNRHLSGCRACRDLLADYRGLAVEGA